MRLNAVAAELQANQQISRQQFQQLSSAIANITNGLEVSRGCFLGGFGPGQPLGAFFRDTGYLSGFPLLLLICPVLEGGGVLLVEDG